MLRSITLRTFFPPPSCSTLTSCHLFLVVLQLNEWISIVTRRTTFHSLTVKGDKIYFLANFTVGVRTDCSWKLKKNTCRLLYWPENRQLQSVSRQFLVECSHVDVLINGTWCDNMSCDTAVLWWQRILCLSLHYASWSVASLHIIVRPFQKWLAACRTVELSRSRLSLIGWLVRKDHGFHGALMNVSVSGC